MANAPAVPHYSDVGVTLRWVLALATITVATVVLSLSVPRPEPALVVGLVGAALVGVVAALGLRYARVSPAPAR